MGICVNFLPKKLYYLHSAGEFCFLAGLASGAGLSVYPHTVQKLSYQRHHYGNAYWLGWAACILQTLAALCLMFDHLVRESSRQRHCPRCCCLCCRRIKRRKVQRQLASANQKTAEAIADAEEQIELKAAVSSDAASLQPVQLV
uniref:Solute carrier organic anion transporter family member 5A1 n=1 Tax=Macrostomum lignano TaxID=282301 RepID=A0A1I8IZV9_9PLAT